MQEENFEIRGIREIYHEEGVYQVKIVFADDVDICYDDINVVMLSDGKQLEVRKRPWGKKVMFDFDVDEDSREGMINIKVVVGKVVKHFTSWIIK